MTNEFAPGHQRELVQMTRTRRGFTLLEMGIVLAIMAVSAILVAPAFGRIGQNKPPLTGDAMLKLLHDSRQIAIERNETVTLRIDPTSGRYRADTVGVSGVGELGEGTLTLGAQETMVTDLLRLTYVFHPTGSAFADTVLVRGGTTAVLVSVDPWNGVAYALAR